MSDKNKNGSGNSIEKVVALINEYLLTCALEGRNQDVRKRSNLLQDAISVLEPEYEEAKRDDHFHEIKEVLPIDRVQRTVVDTPSADPELTCLR